MEASEAEADLPRPLAARPPQGDIPERWPHSDVLDLAPPEGASSCAFSSRMTTPSHRLWKRVERWGTMAG